MTQECEFVNQCGFYANFSSNTQVIKESWIKLYCESKEVSELCERKIIRHRTGSPPVDNMSPTGKLLQIRGIPLTSSDQQTSQCVL